MKVYQLYLESGPRRQKTLVHVLDLLGCVSPGPTTEQALLAAPEAIRSYLRFLLWHGEAVDPDGPVTLAVAEHVTQGDWLGNGSPQVTFQPDLLPLSAEDVELYSRRLEWLRADLLALVKGTGALSEGRESSGEGRPVPAILSHILQADRGYLSSGIGKAEGMADLLRGLERGEVGLLEAMERSVEMATRRIRAATADERTRIIKRGKESWTARKSLRRMLEHEWEHMMEISRRLAEAGSQGAAS